jgi:hypothetical protein
MGGLLPIYIFKAVEGYKIVRGGWKSANGSKPCKAGRVHW